MRIPRGLWAVVFSGFCLASAASAYEWRDAPASQNPPSFQKVMIVVFENTDYREALGKPFFGTLAKEGVLLSNFHAETHPSQPNYIALISGDTHGVTSDKNIDLNARHIGDLLEAKQKSWKVYAEKYPGRCFLGARSSTYVRKHTPFLSFLDVQKDSNRCDRIVDAGALASDVSQGTLPDFSLYIPDLNNDGHDTNSTFADRWFSGAFGPLLKNPQFMRGMLLVVTFDEEERAVWSAGEANHIYTVLYGPSVIPGSVLARRYDHYNLLRTIEDAFQLGTLGLHDAPAAPIAGVWK